MDHAIERRSSFNGGEVSPWTDPRTDLDKYRSSCREVKNMRPSIYGGLFSRPGTVMVTEQTTPGERGRLIAFEFSAMESLVLEFTDGLMRVITTGDSPAYIQKDPDTTFIWFTATDYEAGDYVKDGFGGDLYYCLVSHTSGVTFAADLALGYWVAESTFQLPTPWAPEDLDGLCFQQQNDAIFIAREGYQPMVLSRIENDNWELELFQTEWPPTRDENITATELSGSATSGTITVTTSIGALVFEPGHVGSRWIISHIRTDPWVKLIFGSAIIGDTSAALYALGEWSLSIVSGDGTGAWDAVIGVQRSYDGSTWETLRTMAASRSARSGIITGIELEGCFLRIIYLDFTGTVPPQSNVTLEALDARQYGIVEITGYTDPSSVTAETIFPLFSTAPTTKWREGAWSDYRGWPRAIAIHEQRLFFGGNDAQPQTVWGSVINDYTNFRTGSEEDLGLAFTMASLKANPIQWLVSQDTLLIGTAGEEGPLGSRESDKALTPANAKLGRFTTTGSAYLPAIPVQDTVVFVNRPRRKAWEMSFDFTGDGYKANDLTLLAEHIADSPIQTFALQKNPETILWFVTENGQLIGLVYERGQQVAGWFRYDTDGIFESVAVVGGDGEEDQIWVIVNRLGSRYVERFQIDRIRLLKDAKDDDMEAKQSRVCSSDCSVIYDGAPATVITGLDHLNGEAVSVLADGIVIEDMTVAGGQITLVDEASVVIVGLPFEAQMQPTWQETSDPNTITKVALKRMTGVDMELWRSLGCEYSLDNGERFWKVQFRAVSDLTDTAIPLFTGMTGEQKAASSGSAQQRSVIVRQRQPLPLNIMSLFIRYELNIPA